MLIKNAKIDAFMEKFPMFDPEGILLFFIDSLSKFTPNDHQVLDTAIKEILNKTDTMYLRLASDISKVTVAQDPSVANRLDQATRSLEKLESVSDKMNTYLEKFAVSAVKGRRTEMHFKTILEQKFPLCDIVSVPSGNQKGKMDLNIVKDNAPTILIDTKDYTSNVPGVEVSKFERDILMSGNHGILVSPYSGIFNKHHFQITRLNNSIGVYLSNTGLEANDIGLAVEVIYFIDNLLKQDSAISFNKDTISEVNTKISKVVQNVKDIRQHLSAALLQCDTSLLQDILELLKLKTEKKAVCKGCGKSFVNISRHVCKRGSAAPLRPPSLPPAPGFKGF